VNDTNNSHTKSTPTFVQSTKSKSQGKYRCDNNKHSVNGLAQAETNLGVSEITYKNDEVVGDTHFSTSVLSDKAIT
jgi:hypothetical protein